VLWVCVHSKLFVSVGRGVHALLWSISCVHSCGWHIGSLHIQQHAH
jgi:hypothetical protein